VESGVLVIRNILLLKPAKLYEENPPKSGNPYIPTPVIPTNRTNIKINKNNKKY